MSARNRELLFLIPALILTTLGFALVYTAEVGDAQLVVAHVRRALPGCSSPSPTSAAGFSLPRPTPICCRSRRCSPPWASCCSTASTRTSPSSRPCGWWSAWWPSCWCSCFVRDLRLLARLQVLSRRARAAPAAGRHRGHRAGDQRGPALARPGPDPLPAGGVRQDLAGHLLRRLPGRRPRGAHREHPPGPGRALPAVPLSGAAPHHLGLLDGPHDLHEGPGHQPALLRRAAGAASTWPPAGSST